MFVLSMKHESQNGIVYFKNSKNIGDDIQTYAASQMIKDAVFCDREELHLLTTPTKLLCNGWFMENGEHWPPSPATKSLFLSFHLSSSSQQQMTRSTSISYFRQHQPIGCRDVHTKKLLQKHHVESYFSGCLTLTLPHYDGNRNNEILFVDVLRKNYTSTYRKNIINKLVPERYKKHIQYLTHFSNDIKHKSIEQRMADVKILLDRYKQAKVVFTSLIHCALPCVAMGTPVVFIDAGFNNNAAKRDRFGGVLDLLPNVVDVSLPFGERSLLHQLTRLTGIYRLSLAKIKPLDKRLFNLKPIESNYRKMTEHMKKSVHHFFSKP